MKWKLLILAISFSFNTFAQIDYVAKGKEAMEVGNYNMAVSFFEQVYKDNPTDENNKLLSFARTIRDSFDKYESDLRSENFHSARRQLNNILSIDPSNTFVNSKFLELETKEKEVEKREKNVKADYRRSKNKAAWSNFGTCFWGEYDRHDNLGGLRIYTGYSNGNFTDFDPNLTPQSGFTIGLVYNNFKKLPVGFGFDYTYFKLSNTYSFYGSYHLFPFNSEYFTLGLGLGSRHNDLDPNVLVSGWNEHFFFRPSLTVGIGEAGMLQYSYTWSTKKDQLQIPLHTITYTFGRDASKTIAYTGLVVVGILLIAALGSISA